MPALTVPVQVRFADIDVFNHVNNVAYFALMETARLQFLREHHRSFVGHIVVARSECDYKKEIRGGTRWVDVTVTVESVGRTSFVIRHDLYVADELMAVGRTVQVVLDGDRNKRLITDEERAFLLADEDAAPRLDHPSPRRS